MTIKDVARLVELPTVTYDMAPFFAVVDGGGFNDFMVGEIESATHCRQAHVVYPMVTVVLGYALLSRSIACTMHAHERTLR